MFNSQRPEADYAFGRFFLFPADFTGKANSA